MGGEICKDNVLIVSGKWALQARMSISDHGRKGKLHTDVQSSLMQSGLHPVGEDGSLGFHRLEAAELLERDSKIHDLEKRYNYTKTTHILLVLHYRIKHAIRKSPNEWLKVAEVSRKGTGTESPKNV